MSSIEDSFLHHFSTIEDPRTETKNKKHKLIDIIVISVCASIYQIESWESIAEFGRGKEKWFKSFLELPNGIPSHDTFRRLFLILKPEYFEAAFLRWTESLKLESTGDIIALDGKTARGSKSKGKKGIHLVNAWSCTHGLVLGQRKTEAKSNEITAIPELLDALTLKGSIVTSDAMGCQKDIAEKIRDAEGDYVLALKGNHGIMYDEVCSFFEMSLKTNFADTGCSYYETEETGHGRVENRRYYYVDSVNFLSQHTEWKDLRGIGMTENNTIREGKEVSETRYFLCSITGDAEVFGNAVRNHWKVENQLHWVLDVQYREDESQKGGHSAANFSIIRKLVMNLLKRETSSKKRNPQKRVQAMLDDSYLMKLLISA